MMNILVVYAHPNPNSFNSTIKDRVSTQLQQQGHRVELLDLYEDNFQPCMSGQERDSYMDKDNTQTVSSYVEQLQNSDALVMIYPTWWMGPPAILKGWFDRVWLPSVVAEFGAEGVKPKLTNIRKIAVITTQGSSWLRMNLIGNPPRFMMKLCLKICTGCKDIHWLALYSVDKIDEKGRTQFLEKIKRKLPRLFSE